MMWCCMRETLVTPTRTSPTPEVDRLLALDVDAIIGAASSAVSKLVIDKITGNNVIQVSPANTSPDFTTYDDNGLYFRTAPSDLLQGKVLADLVASEGNEIAGVIFRQESYGQGLADSFKENFESQGGTVDPFIAYAPVPITSTPKSISWREPVPTRSW